MQAMYMSGNGQAAYGAMPPTSGTDSSNGIVLHLWVPPSRVEQQYFDQLFAWADTEQRGAIGGRVAVPFFMRSNVDKNVLREVRPLCVLAVAWEKMNAFNDAGVEHCRLAAAE